MTWPYNCTRGPLRQRPRAALRARPAPQGRSGWQNQGSAPAAELHNAGGSPRTDVGMQSPPLSAFVTPGPRDSTSGAVAKPPQGCSVQPLLGARRRESSRKSFPVGADGLSPPGSANRRENDLNKKKLYPAAWCYSRVISMLPVIRNEWVVSNSSCSWMAPFDQQIIPLKSL